MRLGGKMQYAKESFMIRDEEGFIASTKEYVRGNPQLFDYLGYCRINSTVVHTFQFRTAP